MQTLADFPDLVRDWHPSRNGTLRPEEVTAGSDKKIWWRCSRDHAHEWHAAAGSRARGHGCPFCSGHRATHETCLATKRPDVARLWHPDRNAALDAREVGPASGRRVWWRCPEGPDHEWQAPVREVVEATGCPFCAGRRLSVTNALSVVSPAVAAEWHPSRNGALQPSEQSATAWQLRWWKCPHGPDHVWEQHVWSRVKGGHGCPFCYGRRVSMTNALATLRPDVAELWHPTKNAPLTPRDVTSQSGEYAWWKCPAAPDQEWRTKIGNCVNGTTRCPFCAGRNVSVTNSLATQAPLVAAEWHPTKNAPLTPSTVTTGSNRSVWWLCSLGHEWRTRIEHRTGSGSGCPTCFDRSRRGRKAAVRKVVREKVRLGDG